jgi:hypothetical protein
MRILKSTSVTQRHRINLNDNFRRLWGFFGADTNWDDLRFPATQLRVNPATLKPDFDTTNVGFLFDAGSVETLYLIAQMPHGWKLGSTLYPHVHWEPTTTDTGNVYWRLEYKWTSIGETEPGSWTTLNVLDAGDGTALKHQIVSLGTMVGTGQTLSSIISMKLSRVANDGTDTYTGEALLKEFDIHYEMDTLGSREEYEK